MIETIKLTDGKTENNVPYEYVLSGNSEATILTVLISGMLYDAKKPPESSILTKIKRKTLDKALSLEVQQMDNSFLLTDEKRELPAYVQSKRIEDSIADVLEKYPKINKINYIAHSMGSVVLYNLLKNQPDFYKNINSSCFLLAPIPLDSNVDDLARDTTESLLIKDNENSTQSKTSFIERDKSKVEIDEEVWQYLKEISDDYKTDLSQFSWFEAKNALSVYIASEDRVFKNNEQSIKRRFPGADVLIFRATHSFKDEATSKIITDKILDLVNKS